MKKRRDANLKASSPVLIFIFAIAALFLASCGSPAESGIESAPGPIAETARNEWDWFDIELTDVQTGKTFTMNQYAGKVVLVETMAIWCPNCVVQSTQMDKLQEALGHPDDLISVSLDVDINEDAASLKEYASSYRFNWHFAIAPLEVARALGNLYSAEYLNPPLAPMLLIDRDGNVHQLKYGIKDAETLQEFVEPYLAK